MKFSFLILILLVSSFSLRAQNGWYQQYVLAGYYFSSIQFFNQDTGYVSAYNGNNSIILKTTNSGNNWNIISNISNSRFRSIFFRNQSTGWACGQETSLFEAAIFRTTNSGINWELQVHDGFWDLQDITFNNDTTGWSIGWDNEVFKSTNGGNNWLNHSGLGSEVNDIFFLNSQYGWIAGGGESGSIVRTTNGGINWIVDVHLWTGYNSVYFADQNKGWAVGYYNDPQVGVISRTTNGGLNWIRQNISSFDNVMTVYFKDSLNGWISADVVNGNNKIFRSTDRGVTWNAQTGDIPFVTKFFFTDTSNGWATGEVIMKTTTGGFTPFIPLSEILPKQFSLHQNYPNPFNPATKIKFEIPGDNNSVTLLKVYDILGRQVRTLVNENLKPGVYEADFNAVELPSGVYFYKLTSGQFVDTKKMILMK